MKLFYSKGSCSLVVRILINEIGIDCEYEAVNLATKITESGCDFLSVNAKGSVPALLLDNGELLTENVVIQQYLADTYQAYNLLPSADNFLRYRALEWLNFITSDLHKSFAPLFNSQIPEDLKDKIFKPLLIKKLDFINKHLEKNAYLLGEEYMLPDGYLFVILTWLARVGLDISNWPLLADYKKKVLAREPVQRSLKEENLIT
ncbi:Glutathione S-transferase GST-6.0 [Candidatus Jidaibacter acanthamoeba]|uniref:Glutathione S-transferase GST-6.0 n=1 Tax=Candidatus Jidaibacter acanthamoebae TaxID=86105 RepID=A0A0C1QZE6_9RICK|nr:glutathione transferase GstA [Candidatus Jidaibacter acanthamoeba]KIE05400.1 Glutathione S-transferase GST-6.0 [Candidatus Jidaibacter acanthamoeba]